MKTAMICKLVTLPLLLMSCTTDGEPGDPTEDDVAQQGDEGDTTATALCLAPPTPPPTNAPTWILPPSRIVVVDDYGSGECAAHVRQVSNVETITAKPWTLDVSTPEKCVGASITMRRYDLDGTWSYVGTTTKTGVWTAQGCELPEITWQVHKTGTVRIHVKAKQTVCAGQFCGTTYAVPMKIAGYTYEPPPGPN